MNFLAIDPSKLNLNINENGDNSTNSDTNNESNQVNELVTTKDQLITQSIHSSTPKTYKISRPRKHDFSSDQKSSPFIIETKFNDLDSEITIQNEKFQKIAQDSKSENTLHDSQSEVNMQDSKSEPKRQNQTISRPLKEILGIIPNYGPDNQNVFVCRFLDSSHDEYVPNKQMRKRYPLQLIKFYESHMIGIPPNHT